MELITVKQAAEKFNMKKDEVRDFCHARGQKFAYQKIKNGKIYINPDLFMEFLERRRLA